MPLENDPIWEQAKRLHRRANALPPTDAELDSFDEAEPLDPAESEDIVSAVLRGRLPRVESEPVPECWSEFVPDAEEEELLQLNRNRGDADEKVDDRLAELRRKLLEDDDDDQSGLEDL